MASSSIGNISKLGDEIFAGVPSDITISGRARLNIKVKITQKGLDNTANRIRNRLKESPIKLLGVIESALLRAINDYDIIDSGKLSMSGRVTYSNDTINITYDVPYAALVHYGGYIIPYGNKAARIVYIPARPWISDTLDGRYTSSGIIDQYRRIISDILKKY